MCNSINTHTHMPEEDRRRALDKVWYSASREPSDTLPGSQPCTQTHSIYHTPYSQGFSFFQRHSRRRLGSPCMVTHIARVWINRVRLPILGLVQSTRFESVSSLLQSPRCNLNLVRLFPFSLPLPMFGRIFFLLPRGHKPTAPFVYCAIPDPRVKCGGAPVPRDASKAWCSFFFQ